MAQRRWWCWRQSCLWQWGVLWAVPQELSWAHWRKMEDTTSKLCSWDHAQHTETHLSSVFQWVGWAKSQILKFNPCLCMWLCLLLCQPLHSCASITQQDPPAFPAGIRNAQECFKQRLFLNWKHHYLSQVIYLLWYWPLWKHLCWTLVKFQNYGAIL